MKTATHTGKDYRANNTTPERTAMNNSPVYTSTQTKEYKAVRL